MVRLAAGDGLPAPSARLRGEGWGKAFGATFPRRRGEVKP
jgi:hypothetical protein